MRGRVAPHLLGAGIALGLGWHILQQAVPERLDFALGFGFLFIVLSTLHGRGLLHVPDSDRIALGLPALVLIGAIVWRDSDMLFDVNMLALAGLVAFARPVRVGLRARLFDSGVGDLIRRVVHAARCAATGAWPLLVAARGPESARPSASAWSSVLGVAAVSPVLFVFGSLLSSADPALEQLLGNVLDPDLVSGQLVPLVLWSWLGAGLLWSLTRPPSASEVAPPGGRASGPMIAGALVPIALLFLLFLLLQSRYLLGGRAVVLDTANLSFSEYARRGFFELVAVSTMMLPILLFADWVADQHAEADRRRFRFLARCLLVLLSGMLGSALMRMSIYTGEYGLTELRLYTTVFMGWLAFVYAWFAASVLRGRRERFTAGALGSALATLVLLNMAGPDEVIVRTNAWRARHGQAFDTAYIASLGAGAVPAVLAVLPDLSPRVRCDAERRLLERWVGVPLHRNDVWTIERWRARSLLERQSTPACWGRRIGP
jgi:hypothetical protein